MHGAPIRRTILVWICILSLIFAGCAQHRSSVLPERKTVQALAVIPTRSVPEINVVRMGNSRVVGALQGAGRGFLEGVAVVAQGTSGIHGTGGEGDVAVIAVLVALMMSVGIVNAVIEGVKGSRVPAPYEVVSDPDEATRERIASLEIQKGFARLVAEEARGRLSIPVSLEELPAGKEEDREQLLRKLMDSGIDAALRVEIARVGFEGQVGKDQPISLVLTLKAEFVRTTDGTTVYGRTYEYRSAAVPPEEWVKDEFRGILRESDDGVRFLAKRCVDDLLESGLVPIP